VSAGHLLVDGGAHGVGKTADEPTVAEALRHAAALRASGVPLVDATGRVGEVADRVRTWVAGRT
jgi:pilus assembly protein TadC